MNLVTRWWLFFIMYLVMLLGLPVSTARAAPEEGLSKGQLVYVPVYSHVYYGDFERKILLTGMVSIRNTDPAQSLIIVKADYYDSEGQLIKSYLSQPMNATPKENGVRP